MALKNRKEKNFSEWYTELVGPSGAHLADIRYGIQGAIVETPWAVKIIRAFEAMIEREVEADSHEPMLFPTIVPEQYIKKEKEHVEGFAPELYWVTKAGKNKQELDEHYYLRPTGESQIFPMYSIWVRSHNDLPLKRYQSRITVFRFEPTTRPFLRGREFNFFETHNVFATHEEALKQIRKDMQMSANVFKKQLGLPFIYFKRPEWDKFAGAVDTYAADVLMPDGRVNQIASTHDLGQNFSKTYNIKYTDKNEKEQYAWQQTWGPGIVRTMAALIGVHGDNQGLVLPFSIAPIQIVIVPITFEKSSRQVTDKCRQLERFLKEKGYRVKFDSSNNTAGWKFNQWELLGVPIRIEVGPKEVKQKKVTIVRRDNRLKETVSEKDLEKHIQKYASGLLKSITEKAEKELRASIREAKTLNEVKSIFNKNKGIVKVPWCSVGSDGANCADTLQKETDGGKVRGTLFSQKEEPSGKCMVCGKKAKEIVYLAKSY